MSESTEKSGLHGGGTRWTSRSDAAVAQERADKRAAEEASANHSQQWNDRRPTKTMLAWACIAAVALTLLVGFQVAGWQTAGDAQTMATSAADLAVVDRLASICVAQSNLDPERDQKLVALRESSAYQRGKFVTDQQWATMPGDDAPVGKVAEACARLLVAATP